ncbi:MAG: hypothetical protein HYS77_11655, partial [Candidatus Rokubacteria bacterium]|nr:hypothetical protein [Candidatus Rokubacteria bacterium]
YRKYWRQATEALDRGDYQPGLVHVDQALLILTHEDSKHLSQDQVDARRYFILTTRSLWRAYLEKRAQGEAQLKENTGRHLGEAFQAWLRMPGGILPAEEITESRMFNVVRYMCSPDLEKYVRPEDAAAKTEVCRRAELGRLLLADGHLHTPPTFGSPAARGTTDKTGRDEKVKDDTPPKIVPLLREYKQSAPKEERREFDRKK